MIHFRLRKSLKGLITGFVFLSFLSLEIYAQPLAVIETYEAGPEKVKRQVSRVKTNFSWSKTNTCDCPSDETGPCIQSFLDKRIPQPTDKYPSRVEDYYIQNNMGSEYQGAGQVPWGMDFASVRILNIPFCRAQKRAQNKSS